MPNPKSNQEVNNEFENLVSNLGKVTLVHSEEPQMVVVATKIDDDSLGSVKTSVKCLQIQSDYRLNVSFAMGLVNKDPAYLSTIRKLNQSFLHKYDLNDLNYLDKCQYLDRANRNAREVLSFVLEAKVYKPKNRKSKLTQNISPVLPYKPMTYKSRKISSHGCNQEFQKPETLQQQAETSKDILAKEENSSREKNAYQEHGTIDKRVSESLSDDESINYHEYCNISDHEYNAISDHEYHAISESEYYEISDSEYHEISDGEYHEISGNEYHEISDDEYHEISDDEYHEISDDEYHGDNEYHEINDGEYHGISERKYTIGSSEQHSVYDHDQHRHVSVTSEDHVTITSEEDQPHPMSSSVSPNKDYVENTTHDTMLRWSKNRNKTTRPENLACRMSSNDLYSDRCVLNKKSDGDSPGTKIAIAKPHSVSSYQTMRLEDDNNKTSQDIPTDLSSLSVEDIGRLLKSFNMTRYVAKFESEQINGEILMALDENALKSLDLTYFHARKLIKVITGGRPKNDDKSATTTD